MHKRRNFLVYAKEKKTRMVYSENLRPNSPCLSEEEASPLQQIQQREATVRTQSPPHPLLFRPQASFDGR